MNSTEINRRAALLQRGEPKRAYQEQLIAAARANIEKVERLALGVAP